MSKVCLNCAHCWRGFMGVGPTCDRRKSFNLVQGEVVNSRSCLFERSRLWRWLGLDTCGPDGRYFVKRVIPAPPNAGSGVSKAA